MHQVIYSSAAVAPFTETELGQLLARARVNNERLGISGLLLYDEGSFLQVLEGEQQVIEKLYDKIEQDKRHHRLVALLRRDVEERHFGQWRMGFAAVNAFSKKLPGYSDYLRARGDASATANAAARLLASFRDGRFHSYVAA